MKALKYILCLILMIFVIYPLNVWAEEDTVSSKEMVLEELRVNDNLWVELKENQYEYEIFLDQDSLDLVIEYKTPLDDYYIKGVGEQTLVVGKTHYILIVDKDGNLSLYTFKIERKRPFLGNLSFDEIPDFVFQKDKFNYELEVDYQVDEITPRTTLEDDTTLEIIGALSLHPGANTIIFRVRSNATGLERDYVFRIVRNLKVDTFSEAKSYSYEAIENGNYVVELWGASGGINSDGYGHHAKGAYTKGTIYLDKGEMLYVYVGEAGKASSKNVSFNGGGFGGNGGDAPGASGGGATDIRLVGGNWDDDASLRSRIMVAGAGGGIGVDVYSSAGEGSYAGGLTGYSGGYYPGHSYVNQNGKGGTQTSGGSAGNNHFSASGTAYAGSFGVGGNNSTNSDRVGAAGGGGGYYGGGAGGGTRGGGCGQGAGGGSSFISGHAGSIAITETGTPKVSTYTKIEDAIHYSGKRFSNTQMIDGLGYDWTTVKDSLELMPNPDGGYYESGVGHTGNGYAKITYVYDHVGTGLKTLNITGGTLDKDFDNNTYEYNLHMGPTDEEIIIEAEPEEEWSIVSGTGNFVVPNGNSMYIISVLNYDGEVVNYVINVLRDNSNYKYLDGIKINGVLLDGFKPTTEEYDIELDTGVDNVNIEAIKHLSGQVIGGDGEGNFSFLGNELTVNLLVKSEDGSNNTNYVLHFIRKRTSQLKYIKTPHFLGFASDKLNYTIEVLDSIYMINVETETYFEGTKVTIEGNKYLSEKENIITVISHLDGVEDTVYKIKVIKKSEVDNPVTNIDYTGEPQEFIVPYSGYYEIQLWGASGGYSYYNDYGKGGYTKGKIKLLAGEKLYFYLGEAGKTSSRDVSFNGGGSGGQANSGKYGSSGGGATDVRLVGGSWTDVSSLRSRIMVASAGGGGTVEPYSSSGPSSFGGGLTGYAGGYYYGHRFVNQNGKGGTQISGGAAGNNHYSAYGVAYAGSFGVGGNNDTVSQAYGAGGGGGGYYGGGAGGGTQSGGGGQGGGGGSSYISGHAGSIAINENGIPKVTTFTGLADSYHYSEKIFTETKMIDGRGYNWTTSVGDLTPMPNPDGGYYANGKGHEGNGRAKITLLSTLSDNNYLEDIVLDEGAIALDFLTTKEDYVLNLDETHKKIKIEGIPKDKNAEVIGNEEIPLSPGETKHRIIVTATDGSVRTYTITINRQGSSDPKPIDIVIDGLYEYLCSVKEEYCNYKFDKDITEYNIVVPYDINKVWFKVKPNSEYQNITYSKINGDEVIELSSTEVELNGGVNIFQIELLSEDLSQNVVYTFNIDRDVTGNNLLKSLEVHNPDIAIDFKPYTYEYFITIPKEATSYEVVALPESDKATVTINEGHLNLHYGMNDCLINVRAENGETRTYIIHAYKEVNESTLLKTLEVSNGSLKLEISPEFNKYVNNYSVDVANEVEKVNVTGILEDGTTTGITGLGEYELMPGVNKINVVVTTKNGDTNIYQVVVNRAKSGNNNLGNLEVKDHVLSPEFHKDTLEYEISIEKETTSVEVLVQLEDENATYTIRGNNNLNKAINEIIVTVVAQNKEYKVYKIKAVKKISDNNYLESLTTNRGDVSPEFDKTKTEYTLSVDGSVTSIEVVGVPEDKSATVTGNGVYYLAAGDNYITITVTAESGMTLDYNLVVTKSLNDDLSLKEVKNNQGSEVTKLEHSAENPDNIDYLINVQYEVNRIEITGIPNAITSTVTGNKHYDLAPGNNDIILQVMSEAGNTKDYKVRVVRDLSSNDDLEFLYVKEGGLKPTFNETTIMYDVLIPNEKNSIQIEAITEDENSTCAINNSAETKSSCKLEIDVSSWEVDKTVMVPVVVRAPKGNTKTYTLNVMRQKATSETLALLNLETNRGVLTPLFNPDTKNYELTVENDVKDITVTGTLLNEETTYIEGNGTYNLRVGKNAIAVFVVSQETEIEEAYQIVVTRKKSSDARLQTLAVKNHTLSPIFDKDNDRYNLKTSLTELDFSSIVPVESEATYQIIGNENFVSGANTVIIRVTAPDGDTTKDYVLTVTKEGSKNNNLASLEVVGYSIVPKFHKGVTFYTVEVANDVNSVVINAVSEDSSAVITGTGMHIIETGENYIDVEVESESGVKKTYTILVTKEASDNNYLATLTSDIGDWDKVFSKEEENYQIVVSYEETQIELFGTLEDVNSSVAGLGSHSLEVGDNYIDVIVISESGVIRTYSLKVVREALVSAYLLDIKVQDYELDNEFNKELLEYFINVNYETTELDLTLVKEDEAAIVVVTGNENFEVGMNEVHILVTASDNVTIKEYILYVNRAMSSNNYLRDLRTSEGVLSPVFNPETLEYDVEVESNIDSIIVDATPEDETAVITSKIGSEVPYKLEKGPNKITVKVRSMMGITRTYILNVTRKVSNNNYLADLKVYAGEEKELQVLDFNKEVISYQITLAKHQEYIEIEAKVEDLIARVTGTGVKLLVSGTNYFTVGVTAEDGTIKNYELEIINPKSSDNLLTMIIPSAGVLSPEFSSEVTEYTLDLDSDVNTLSFKVTKASELATVSGDELAGVPEGTSTRAIIVKAEDETEKVYTITVNRVHNADAKLQELKITGYEILFDADTLVYNLRVSESKKELKASEITAVPRDSEATVNLMGDIKLAKDIVNVYTILVTARDGYTTEEYTLNITRDSDDYTIRSNLYEIVRFDSETEEDYVIGIQPSTIIPDFKNNFENDASMLHVYRDMTEVDETDLTATALILKLEKEGYVYDTLRVIVRGDLTSDGKVNITDQVKLINYVGRTVTFNKYEMLAGDLTFDGKVNITDQVKLINYVGRTVSDLNKKPTN